MPRVGRGRGGLPDCCFKADPEVSAKMSRCRDRGNAFDSRLPPSKQVDTIFTRVFGAPEARSIEARQSRRVMPVSEAASKFLDVTPRQNRARPAIAASFEGAHGLAPGRRRLRELSRKFLPSVISALAPNQAVCGPIRA